MIWAAKHVHVWRKNNKLSFEIVTQIYYYFSFNVDNDEKLAIIKIKASLITELYCVMTSVVENHLV